MFQLVIRFNDNESRTDINLNVGVGCLRAPYRFSGSGIWPFWNPGFEIHISLGIVLG